MRTERFRVVSVLDEELDASVGERLLYAGTRDFESIAHKFKPGGKPVVYHVREVPHGLWEDFVDAPDSYSEKYKRAFMCGIERVENLPQLDGVSLGTWAPITAHRSGAVILSDADLRLFAPSERAEIGSVIYTHSFLPRRIAATYLLPASLQEPLTSLALRHADANQSSVVTPSNGAHSALTTPNPGTTEPSTGARGADSGSPTHANVAAAASL